MGLAVFRPPEVRLLPHCDLAGAGCLAGPRPQSPGSTLRPRLSGPAHVYHEVLCTMRQFVGNTLILTALVAVCTEDTWPINDEFCSFDTSLQNMSCPGLKVIEGPFDPDSCKQTCCDTHSRVGGICITWSWVSPTSLKSGDLS